MQISLLGSRSNMRVVAALVLFFLPLSKVWAGTDVQGTAHGVWSLANSPYRVIGDIIVPSGDTLRIEPGVIVTLNENCNIKVFGTLLALGTDSSHVVFQGGSAQPGYWGSLYFDTAFPPSVLQYVDVRDAFTGVVAVACSLDVRTSIFTNNITGMDCKSGTNPRLDQDAFVGNTNSALRITDASPMVTRCTFRSNALGDLQPAVTISGSGLARVQQCIFRDNGDVAIQVEQADSAVVVNNSIVKNTAGIVVSSSRCLVSSNIVSSNDVGVGIYTPVNVSVTYNDVWNNVTADYDGDTPGLGVNVTVNTRGDSCDLWYNISKDPQFLWPDSTDLTLSAASPCIDAGDPQNPAEIAYLGDAPDMGAFEHDPNDQRLPVELTFLRWSNGALFWATASETNNLGFLVQFSKDERVWQTLGFVPGAGTTTQPQHYTYRATQAGYYRLVQVDLDGTRHTGAVVQVQVSQIAPSLRLATFPNPANPSTSISLTVPKSWAGRETTVSIFNVTGRRVVRLYQGRFQTGLHLLHWDGRDGRGKSLPSGLYTVVLRQGSKQVSRRIVLLR